MRKKPSYTTFFEKWNVKYSDTCLVCTVLMYVPCISPYVHVFPFYAIIFHQKKFAYIWYFIHATFSTVLWKWNKYVIQNVGMRVVTHLPMINRYIFWLLLPPPHFFIPLVMYFPHSFRYIYIGKVIVSLYLCNASTLLRHRNRKWTEALWRIKLSDSI